MTRNDSLATRCVPLVLGAIFACVLVSPAAGQSATLSSDKDDYSPGEIVILTGSGWLPGETIEIEMVEEPLTHENVILTSIADADGNFTNDDYLVQPDDLGVTFTVTATGLSSSLQAVVIFTDAGACGNGNVQPSQDEECDDDDDIGGDGCSSTCTIEPGYKCSGEPSVCVLACGDGIVDAGEQCDGGTCCTASCTFVSSGTTCRAAAGVCDAAETCTGSSAACPGDGFAAAGTGCRASAGVCDVAETCTGSSVACPADGFAAGGTECRGAADDCDAAETCTGSSAACPTDEKHPDDTPCDDQDLCNVGEACQAGACTGGSAKDCSAEGTQCNAAACDPNGVREGNCDTLTPVADDTPCNDALACNVGEACQAGACTGGSAPDCSSAGDQCNTASCDTGGTEGNCDTLTPVADDTPCDDALACNVGEACQAGACTDGSAPDCSSAGDQCNTASCDIGGTEGNCDTLTAVADDTPCDDEDACTENESCQTGSCTDGSAVDCDDGTSCTTDSCDAVTGCANEPDDGACDDSNVCTEDLCAPDAVGADETTGCDYQLDAESGCDASVTDSSLCPFDVDPDADPDGQFRLIFTPDQNLLTSSKLSASNPGQFYYNAMYVGPGEETIQIEIPFPFVTQGGNPVHVYDSVTPEADGCFTPGDEIASAKTFVVLDDYDPQEIGSTTTVGVELPALSGHFAYINIHLDYGLKRTTGYAKSSQNAAVDASTLEVIIADETDYAFSDSAGGSDTAQSLNAFKRTPGFAGLVTDSLLAPVAGVRVDIYSPTNALLKTVYTDADGWYFWQYKHKGKAATYKIALPLVAPPQQQSVSLQANQLVVVSFTVP